ncbi:hypothetical protein [Caulobacter sp.]|uniref:hypothetical protein n=1 Tax=Caulobacter sp. TaxID=78 RepID=UPI001B24FE33|nr:hypothetical protein [Caulobacter sp.]MBO9543640.1 hypothetical protein [Caulobacter sp.]
MMTAAGQAGPMVLAAYGKAMGVTPTPNKDEPAAPKSPEAEALDRLKASQRNDRRNAIGDAKGRAREKLQKLLEKLKLLKKLYANDPKTMAKALAAAAKELQGAVKDYAKAAKESGEMFKADFAAAPDASLTPDQQMAARKDLEDQAKGEASADMDFIKGVRSIANALKDDLTTAKTKGILTQPGKFERSDEVKEAEEGIKDLETMTEDLDQQIRRDMPPGSLMKLEA